jgi:bifunctional ADP-heptose synthase (sugar kinase/adenylyltransferase)
MDTRSKIITRPLPAELARRFAAGGGEIVAIRGRFELLQASVVRQIEQAGPAAGGTVVAVVAGDGPSNHSLLAERDRAQLVAALGAVDAVVICDEAETDALIAALRPAREIRLDESAGSELIADVLRRNKSG